MNSMQPEARLPRPDKLARTPTIARPIYLLLGLVLVGIGFLGFVLPVLPGTIFLILALAAFRRSSPKLEAWLLNNRLVGPTLRDWDVNGSIRPRTKVIIYVFLWASIVGSVSSAYRNFHDPRMVVEIAIALIVVAVGVTWYIASRPNRTA